MLFLQEVMSADVQQAHADDIQVLSSELIVIEDGAEDDDARTGQRLGQSKVRHTVGTVASPGIQARFRKKADKN